LPAFRSAQFLDSDDAYHNNIVGIIERTTIFVEESQIIITGVAFSQPVTETIDFALADVRFHDFAFYIKLNEEQSHFFV